MRITTYPFIFLFILSTSGIHSFGQLSNTLRFTYKLRQSQFTASGFQLLYDGLPLALCARTKAIVTVSNGRILVDLFQFTSDECGVTQVGFVPGTIIKGKTVEIVDKRTLLGDPTNVLKLPFAAWNFGINSIGFRVRKPTKKVNGFDTYTVTGAFNLAASFGRTYGYGKITTRGMNNYSVTFSAFAGPSSATGSGLPTTNVVASYGGAIILARNGFGIILSYGWDTSMGDHSKDWAYQNKGWFGLGLNASLLK